MDNICIDFDGVIHIMKGYDNNYDGWKNGAIEGTLVPGAKEAIEKLQKKYNVIIFTAREDIKAVAGWLFNNDIHDVEVTNKKVPAVAYIDDHAIRFIDWESCMNDIEGFVTDAELVRIKNIEIEARKHVVELQNTIRSIEIKHNVFIDLEMDTLSQSKDVANHKGRRIVDIKCCRSGYINE